MVEALAPFVGRERELAEIENLLPAGQLLTLTGPPGVGKSRLALEVAARAGATFPDGVAYVSLAALRAAGLVLPSIAQVLGVWERVDRPLLDSVRDAVGQKRLLLVLDNFDQVLSGAEVLAELLGVCRGLSALVTGRSALHVAGERTFAVPPLALPAADRPFSTAEVFHADAVQLFVERARAVQPTFALDDDNAVSVAQVCRKLDGLPLAIELAAARIRSLTPAGLLTRLEQRLALLEEEPDSLAPRQRTLRQTIAWSYDLLSPAEQATFRQLAVFVGRFSAPAAAAVTGGPSPAPDVVALVERSLLQRDVVVGEPYFRVLETVRALALERLAASGGAGDASERHAAHYLALAEEAEPWLDTADGAAWLERLETEHDNLREALRWLIERRQAEEALRLAGALCRLWSRRGYFREARVFLQAALALSGGDAARVKALAGAAAIAYGQGDYAAARALREEQLALQRRRGDPSGIASALSSLALLLREQGDFVATHALLEEALVLYREAGDRRGIAYALDRLGTVAQALGDLGGARASYEEGLDLARQVGERPLLGWIPHNLGRLALQEGRLAEARQHLRESLSVQSERGDQFGILHSLAAFAGLAAAERRWERALRLSGSATALADLTGSAIQPTEDAAFRRSLALARQATGDVPAGAAWEEGRATGLERALGYALADAD